MLKLPNDIIVKETDIPSLGALRQKGKAAFLSLPSLKDEAFKYTPVQNVLTDEMFQPSSCCNHFKECACEKNKLDFEAHCFFFCDGTLHEHFHLTEGMEALPLSEALKNHEAAGHINKFDATKHPFAALNLACLEQGLFLRIEKTPSKPIMFFYQAKQQGLKNIYNVILLEKGVSAEIVEIFEGQNEAYFTNVVNEIFVAKDASLKHYKLQNEGLSAAHIAFNRAEVKSNGCYESYVFQKGGKLSRHELEICLLQESASAFLNAAYKIKGDTLVDTTTNIAHLKPFTTSEQTIKGVIDENARGVFQGKICVAKNAVHTKGYQLHKALLLSDGASVDVKPELEIFADDVKCSHGATCGDLSKDELFYLRSRGICENKAREMLTNAFLKTVFEDISNPNIKNLFENF
ncbi:MAG: Fe-S cluster assembly protein SufD [Alphaproteobacteria bacterium]|nr:Fe-S cluster assembly protein SufD [Alphaproteobacteria bacterium]